MIVTVERLPGRLAAWMLGLVLCSAILAMPRAAQRSDSSLRRHWPWPVGQPAVDVAEVRAVPDGDTGQIGPPFARSRDRSSQSHCRLEVRSRRKDVFWPCNAMNFPLRFSLGPETTPSVSKSAEELACFISNRHNALGPLPIVGKIDGLLIDQLLID